MNKQLVITVVATVLLAASGFANADSGRRGHHGAYHGGHHSFRHDRHHVRRHYRPRHHYRPVYRHGYLHGRHELRKGLKIAAGAILLGSVIHAATDHRRERVVVRRRAAPVRDGSDYYYRYDDDGQCYEVTTNNRGEEVWTYMDPSYCR